MTSRLDISLLSALWLLLAVALGSCSQIYDNEELCEQEQEAGNRVSLKFKIYTDNGPSRSRGLGEWEEKEANVAERILNPEDVRVLMTNKSRQLVRTFRPNVLEYKDGEGITGDGYYELSVFFEDENLDRMEEDEKIEFNVMIFANINSLGNNYTTDGLIYGSNNDNLQELFTMPADWFPSSSKGIPMYGYKLGLSATKAQLADDDYLMGEINMLRAMCKIEVFDKVVGATVASDGKRYPYVEKVELVSWRNKGYLRPLYDGYESGLKTAYIPSGSTVVTEPQITAHYIDDNKKAGDPAPEPGKDEGVFRIYCPEARLADVKLRVLAALAPGEPTKYYEVSLDQYADNGEVFGKDLVRNHIYRFSVNSFSVMAELTVTVDEWTRDVDEYTLDDIISMDADGYLTWTNIADNNNFSVTEENGAKQLSFLLGTTDYATGTFTINSPEGAVWRAFFIPGENGVDAFEFVQVDADGNVTSTSSYVEGTVGTQATIHIRGKGPADVYRHTAQLVVEVHQPDGTVLYAPIAAPGSTSYIIYRENKL